MAALGARLVDPRRELVVIGVAASLVPLVLVGTALDALKEVNGAHAEADRIGAAQVQFVLADQAHDAMRGDVLAVALAGTAPDRAEAVAVLERDVDLFGQLLRNVDEIDLPEEVVGDLRLVRPLQVRFAESVTRFGRSSPADLATTRQVVAGLEAEFETLVAEHAVVTEAMTDEADARQRAAADAERSVGTRVIGSAVAALIAMVGLTLLLRWLGGRLAQMFARERGVAELLQHSLLPDQLPEVAGVRLAARYVPGAVGSEVGGDWYDVIPLSSGEVGLVMGDVVGHDLDAAASMGQLRNALRACAAEGSDPGEVLQRLNRLCMQQNLGSMATVVYAVLDPVTGTLRMANAGHYPPLLVSEKERSFLEFNACPPIGAMREVKYSTNQHQLPHGSLLLFYTDGLVERRDAAVEEGMNALRDLVSPPSAGDDLEGVCDAVLAGMLDGHPTDDDVALLAVAAAGVLGPHLDYMLPAQPEQLAVLRRTLERWLTEAGATGAEVYEITVACSEAITNAIEHAYGPGRADIEVACDVDDGLVTIVVRDWGQWRAARGKDRGRGLLFMSELMDDVDVRHGDGGTQVLMCRQLAISKSKPTGERTTTRQVSK